MDSDTGATLMDHGGGFEGETIAPPAPTPRKPPTTPTPSRSPRSTPTPNLLTSSDAIGGGRFTPGQVLAERYRIVALAGRGGMGEVFRAEDLTLGQIVAMKFLPERLSEDAAALSRFHAEVRNARQVSHPNVCRVFDIGEAEGTLFLTMEYVDGEDLASVVRRIGRLSPDKATEIARQICAGLAAAHERGVIHRDLKPANVMLDGAGKIRITDFGLAGLAASMQGEDARAGTPAYMAPEQLAGKEVTTKSDIYSLGLILYEILTGKRAFEASTLQELVRLRESGTITNPSTLVRDLDPLIERVILRCLETDPDKRPTSALQVAAALPGGDPLAAALAAGETPSPQMVAAAGSTEGIKPWLGMALVTTVLLGLVAQMMLADRYRVQNLTPLPKPADVLLARSQEIVQQLGFTNAPADTAHGFFTDFDYLNYIQEHDKSQTRWQRLSSDRPATIVFWYRQSPRELQSDNFFNSIGSGAITPWVPPSDVTGMISVFLDTHGRLLFFKRIPPEYDPPQGPSPQPDWSPLFAAAGLDPSKFITATPEWSDLLYSDTRAAWTREMTAPIQATERVEAAAYRGKPVYFRVLFPWANPYRDRLHPASAHQELASIIGIVLFAAVLLGSILIVRRNVRQKKGDEAGSWRLANFLFFAFLAMWALEAHHLASLGEFGTVVLALAWAFLVSTFARMLYFGLEPFVRRRDPHTLIGWMRFIGGKIRDPLVGRDILIGMTYGVLLGAFLSVDNVLLPLLGLLPPQPGTPFMDSLLGIRQTLGSVFAYTWVFVLYSLAIFFVLFLVRLLVRKDWIAAIVIVFLGAITNIGGDYFWSTFLLSAVIWLSIYLVLRRFGLLALVAGLVVQNILVTFPMTTHLSRWYASGAIAGITIIIALALFALHTALAGQALFSAKVLDD
ncbi:MAG TPA: serine/threonine-protein kinase [Candidatus Acidoferrum sp.]|nr:serine/threonine-protein kinase [Candidatus Acidoferrum sp.]